MLGASCVRNIIAVALFAVAGLVPWQGALAQEEAVALPQAEVVVEKPAAPSASGAALAEAIEDIDRALTAAEEKQPPKAAPQPAGSPQEQKQAAAEPQESVRPAQAEPQGSGSSLLLALTALTLCCALIALGLTLYRVFKPAKAAGGAKDEAKSKPESSPGLPDDEPLMAFDGNILNREQASAEKLLDVFSAEPVPEYEALAELFSAALKEKFTQAKYEVFEKHVKEKFGDMKEVKFIAFERLDQIDRLTYFANFTIEKLVVIRIGFTKEGKVEHLQLNPYKKQPENRRLGGV